MFGTMNESSDEGFGDLGGLQAMGILNALRTGDPRLDMLLAMALPFVIRFLFDFISKLDHLFTLAYWRKLWTREPSLHHRYLTYRTTQSLYGGVSNIDGDSQNRVLQKAIQLYLHAQVKLNLASAETELTTLGSKSGLGSRYCYDDDEDGNDDGSSRTIVGILSKYKIVLSPPKQQWHDLGHYGEGHAAAVHLHISHNEQNEGDEKTTKKVSVLSFHFKSEQGAAIDAFIDKAYQWYLAELKKTDDHSRYLYELKSGLALTRGRVEGIDDDECAYSSGIVYKRFRLSDEKTFDSLFFRQKKSLLNLIQHFQDRTGKYAIKGYPHKLGLLLHGPPGSGKTSLIKALAEFTRRSIINVPLARITTNAELMSIFFDKNLRVEGEYVSTKLRFQDVIFVLEDVDAASKVVKRRDGRKTAGMRLTEQVEVPPTKSVWQMLLESRSSEAHELVTLLTDKSHRLKAAAMSSTVLLTQVRRIMSLPGLSIIGESEDHPTLKKISDEALSSARMLMDNYETVDRFLGTHAERMIKMLQSGVELDDSMVDELLGEALRSAPALNFLGRSREVSFTKYDDGSDGEVHMDTSGNRPPNDTTTTAPSKAIGPSAYGFKALDELNLQGLLNVLDGVVDSPGRIVIMTSNHPELLDPALIRPGRIDKKLYLGHMATEDVLDMLEHYFQLSLSDDQRKRVERVMTGVPPHESRSRLKLTPAQVEQMTAEHETIDYMLEAMEAKSQSLVPHVGSSRAALAFDV